jgi:flap endonuclease-1
MGVQISGILPKTQIELEELAGKKIAIDTYNIIFQFLSIIRQRETGEPLRDSKGRITSHLSGLFYRSLRLLEAGVKPIFVFDGKPPEFKKKTIKEREERREESLKKWMKAVEEGKKEDIMVYAQGATKLTDDMVEESQKLLDAMGIPWIQAPSEGEAQAGHLVKRGDAYAVGSQDIDSLLLDSPRLIRNLSITGKRKMPRQERWIEVKPEIIELQQVLKELELTREQLIMVGMLVGTDYNPDGVKGIGPKKAVELVKENKTLNKVLESVEWISDVDPEKIYNFFLKPPVSDEYDIEWKNPDKQEILRLMIEDHDFSEERIQKAVDRLLEIRKTGTQVSLGEWFKK